MNEKKDTIWGRMPLEEAFKNKQTLSKVFLQKGITGPFEILVRNHCKNEQIPFSVVPKEKLNRMTKGNHQGVVAWISPIEFVEIEHLIPYLFEQKETPLIVLLEGISDTHNLGAIARSAWYFGAHALIISAKHSAPINAVTVKSSAGAILQIPVSRVQSMPNALEFLQHSGFSIYAADLQAKKQLHQLNMDLPIGLLLGSEGEGISSNTRKNADQLFKINQARPFDSLNVSVAAGICLYEILKIRKNLFE